MIATLSAPAYETACPSAGISGAAYAAEETVLPASDIQGAKLAEERDHDVKREVVRYIYSIGFPVSVMAYGLSSWGWTKRDYWKWSNEGWFGHSTPFGGYDKIGHIFSHYTAMRLGCSVYNYTEHGSNYRFLYSSLLTLLMGVSIEIGDAYSGYGFSYHDIIFDCIGILIGGLLEAFPKADAFVSLSWEYWPSSALLKHPENAALFIDDYGGAKILANIKLAGFREVGLDMPDFMRYIMIDVGYGVKGYTSLERHDAREHFRLPFRSQNIYVGISVNFVEVVKDFFKDPGILGCRITQQVFKYYHVPAGYKHRFTIKESLNRQIIY